MADQVASLTIPVERRSDARLTISRSGELYGCILNLYVKITAGGRVYRVPDSTGNTLVEFVDPTQIRTLPAVELKRAPRVAVDVIVTVKQPSGLTGSVRLEATLDVPGLQASTVSDSLQLVQGAETGILDVGWGITA